MILILTYQFHIMIKLYVWELKWKIYFQKKEYILIQSLEELLKIDKYFRQFDNLKEVFDSIKTIILNKQSPTIKEENELKLKINNLLTNKVFLINIPLKERDIKNEVDNLIPYISSLNNKINDLENENKQMINDLKIMEQKHQEEIKQINNEFKILKEKHQDEIKQMKNEFDNKLKIME